MSNYGFTSAGTSYDDKDRLTGFARASGTFTQSWSLTSVGDWNSITTNGTAQNRTHGPTHELLTAGGQNITTDVKGNITLLPTTLTTSGVAMAVGYDFDNKLKSADVDNNGSNDVTFQYDALGRRVARQGTSGSFVYVQQDQQTIADYGYGDAPSSPTHRYVYASYIDEPVVRKAAGTSGTIHYYHRNQQYSITAVTTSSGSVAERYAYTAYGQPTILDSSGSVLSSSAINNRYTYTGREWDQTLGLYHFRARWMSGLAGRFMGRDPIGYKDGPVLYDLYISLLHVDPLGTQIGSNGSGGTQPGNPILPTPPVAVPPFLPSGRSCTIKLCSSPMVGGSAGHLFILCGGNRYRGEASGTGEQDTKCKNCDGTFGQLQTSVDPWNENAIDHPDYPGSRYPSNQMFCRDITVADKSCDEVCGCINKVMTAVEDCCIPYSLIPTPGPVVSGSNSNSAAGWAIDACTGRNWFYPPGYIRPHPGYGKPMPDCVNKAIGSSQLFR
ncbi:RHS repeat domain-containing protein [Pirellulaceae bacterium SH501]